MTQDCCSSSCRRRRGARDRAMTTFARATAVLDMFPDGQWAGRPLHRGDRALAMDVPREGATAPSGGQRLRPVQLRGYKIRVKNSSGNPVVGLIQASMQVGGRPSTCSGGPDGWRGSCCFLTFRWRPRRNLSFSLEASAASMHVDGSYGRRSVQGGTRRWILAYAGRRMGTEYAIRVFLVHAQRMVTGSRKRLPHPPFPLGIMGQAASPFINSCRLSSIYLHQLFERRSHCREELSDVLVGVSRE